MDSSNTKLWIEYGNLAYNISSYVSRKRKTALFVQNPIGMPSFEAEQLQAKRDQMLEIAKLCFESANKADSTDEMWLHDYMLGKVVEKANILAAIRYYEHAECCLYLDGTSYPRKIQYHNPPALAVEALELHYRIHAAVLKYVINRTTFSSRVLKKLKIHLIRALKSPFTRMLTPSSATSAAPVDHDYATGNASSSSNSCGKTNDAVSELLYDMIDAVCEREKKVDIVTLRDQLIKLCLNAMKRCLYRYPGHYKSLYRLADYYHRINDHETAKALLLGSQNAQHNQNLYFTSLMETDSQFPMPQNLPENLKAYMIPGLFQEKKANNLFNGIWRIPIDDIDRPGSFNSHMFRSVFLLIRVCTVTFDYSNLGTLALQLSRVPDVGKKYLRDDDRKLLARFAFESCSLLLKAHVHNPSCNREKILTDAQRISEKFVKANTFTTEAGELIREIFKAFKR